MKINHNQNKFNKGLKGLLFKEIRFDVSKHPVITTKDKATTKLKVNLSKQERQMYESLASNHFQGISGAKAARIAIYEECMDCSELNGLLLDQTHRRSVPKGHSQREPVQVRLTEWEYELLETASTETDISKDHLIRYAIIRLNKRIKEGTCTKLTNSKLLTQQECQKQDAKKPKDPSRIAGMVAANKAAEEEVEEKRQQYYEAFGSYMEALNAEGWGWELEAQRGPYESNSSWQKFWTEKAREQFHQELNERIESWYQQGQGEEDLLEWMAEGFEVIWFRTKKQALEQAKMFLLLKEGESTEALSEAQEPQEDALDDSLMYDAQSYKNEWRRRAEERHQKRMQELTIKLDDLKLLSLHKTHQPEPKPQPVIDLELARVPYEAWEMEEIGDGMELIRLHNETCAPDDVIQLD